MMKIRHVFWVWLWVAASVRGNWPARIHFLNGDTLSGEVTGISGEEIRFRAGRSDGELRVPAEAVAEIRGLAPQGGVGEPVHEVLPHAGGRLRVSVEEEAGADMLVRMPWGQAVRLPRARIAEVRDVSGTRPLPVEKTLNNILPNGMQFRRPEIAEQTFEGLRVGRGWRAAYQLPADLSASFLLQVDLSFPGPALAQIRLFSAAPQPGIHEGVSLFFRGNVLHMNWLDPEGRLVRHDFPLPEELDLTAGSLRLTFAADPVERTFTLNLQGHAFGPVEMQAFEIPDASWVLLNANPHPVTLHALRFLTEPTADTAAPAVPEGPRGLRTVFGDVWIGASSFGMEDGELSVEVDGWSEDLQVPVGHISVLRFGDLGMPGGNLTLRNGDRLHAELRGMKEEMLVFEPPWSGDKLRVRTRDVKNWYGGGLPPERDEVPGVELQFVDGSVIQGMVLAMDAEFVSLQTLWGQSVRFPVARIAALRHIPEKTLLDGLADPDAWQFQSIAAPDRETPPHFDGGGLVFPGLSNQRMTLPLPDLPPQFLLELEVATGQMHPNYSLFLLPRADSEPREAYLSLQFHANVSMLQRAAEDADLSISWNEDAPEAGRRQTLRLYVDQDIGVMTLFLNGREFKAWNMVRGAGGGIPAGSVFQIATGPMDSMRLRFFRVLPWDGQVPSLPEHEAKPFLILRNGDVMTAEQVRVEDGMYRIITPEGAALNLPPSVVDEVRLRLRDPRIAPEAGDGFVIHAPAAGMVLPGHLLQEEVGGLQAETRLSPDPIRLPISWVRGLHAGE